MTKATILASLFSLLLSISACHAAPQAHSHKLNMESLNDEHLASSIASCSTALDKNPRHVDALLRRSRGYALTDRFDLAISDCDAVLRIDPKNSEAYFQRGLYRGFSGGSGSMIFAVSAARADLEKAARLSTDSIRKAEIAEILSYHREAEEEHQRRLAATAPATTTLREVHQSGLRIRPAVASAQKASH